MDPRSSTATHLGGNSSRRVPIPRPWLSEHHYVRPLHLHPDYRYAPSHNSNLMGGGAGNSYPNHHNMTNIPDSMDILQKQDWKVSWGKLSCCFCLRGTVPQSPSKTSSDHYGANTGGARRYHNDHVPFPAFPILRRNSSNSLLIDENDVYPSGGSVSSFTDSDTSTSEESELGAAAALGARPTHTFDSDELRFPPSPPRPSTPPAAPVTAKPPTITNRSRSAGLPPIIPNTNGNSNASWATPQQHPSARARIDSFATDHTTGGYSGTTNTSRHRRKQQYEFSPSSMKDIWQGKAVDEKLVLPSYVLCQDSNQFRPNDSGYISALEEGSDWGTHNSGSHYDGDNDEEFMDEVTEGSKNISPSHQLPQQKIPSAERRRKDYRPPKANSGGRRTRSRRNNKEIQMKGQLPPHKKPTPLPDVPIVPVYLRKNANMDTETNGNLVVSGWVAFSLGSSLEERLRYGDSKRIDGKSILYLKIVDTDNGGGARMLLHASDGSLVHELPLQRDWMCESREISSRIGRYVHIRSRGTSSPTSSIANVLPVSLDQEFFQIGDEGDEQLKSPQQIAKLHDRLFVSGKGKVYAPDEQHDAAMYIMFSLDALIKNCVK